MAFILLSMYKFFVIKREAAFINDVGKLVKKWTAKTFITFFKMKQEWKKLKQRRICPTFEPMFKLFELAIYIS